MSYCCCLFCCLSGLVMVKNEALIAWNVSNTARKWRGIPTGTPRRRPNFNEFPRHFRVLFQCNFDGRKIHIVSTYSFRCNFDGRKIHVVSTYFFRCNFDGRKIHVVSRTFISVISMVEICTLFLLTFFDVILMGKDLTSFLVSCKLMKTFEKVFPEFVTLNSWLLQDCSL